MKQIHIGEIIKQRRIELGLTQEDLCEGICTPPTMCRIEKDRQTPSVSKLNALLGRLGLPNDKYYAMLSKHEIKIESLKMNIISCNMRKLFQEGISAINQLEQLVDNDDGPTQQFILRSKVLLGKFENSQHIPYTYSEKLKLLFEAINLTIPNFDIDEIGSHWYSLDELKTINQIGITYGDNNHLFEAIEIYYQLIKYIKKKCTLNNDTIPIIILIYFNYSNYLLKMNRFHEANTIAHLGWEHSIEWGRATYLGSLLYVIAESSYCMEEYAESKQFYIQSYYAFMSMKNYSDAEIIKENIYEYFDIKL